MAYIPLMSVSEIDRNYRKAKTGYFDTGKIGNVRFVRTYWHGNTYHLRKAPAALQKQPSNLDWAHFLGRLKWRDYDPQQYFNGRAYLDFDPIREEIPPL